MKDLIRHGDVLFRRTDPDGDKRPGATRVAPGTVIQKGEVTGHAHRISEGEAVILEQYEKAWAEAPASLTARFLEVKATATVSHEEHKPVILAPGLYEILQAREFDYAANLGRRVRD